MAALTAIIPTNTGTVTAFAAVAASDTVDQGQLSSRGALLLINNGNASSDNVTITDFGTTGAGNQLPSNQITDTITTGQAQVYLLTPQQVGPSGLITITHSVTATVTYQLWRLP